MRIINDGLPEALYLALTNDQYDPGKSDYTPSSLNEPAYLRRLKKEFGDQVEEKASSRIWALLGSSVHYMIELAGEKATNTEVERRFYGTLGTARGDYTIGAQTDILDHDKNGIFDMKVTSAWAFGKGVKPEWESQLNVNRWCIWKETGQIVDNLNIVAIWRDWQASKASQPNYPSSQSTLISVPVWSMGNTEDWIRTKVLEREQAMDEEQIADVTPCSPEEMWAKPDKWAVMKVGGHRALKLFEDEKAALAYTASKPDTYLHKRPGERTRCKGYCPVSKFCPVYNQHKGKYGE